MNPDLLRQRRNLILVSCALALAQLAGVTVEKVSILGTELKIENMEVFRYSVWLVWFYFLIRFFQYLALEEDLKLRSSFIEYFNRILENHAKRHRHPSIEKHVYFNINKKSWRKYEVEVDDYPGSNLYIVDVKFWIVVIAKVRSFYSVAVNTPHGTNHILPIIIALIPVTAFLYKKLF